MKPARALYNVRDDETGFHFGFSLSVHVTSGIIACFTLRLLNPDANRLNVVFFIRGPNRSTCMVANQMVELTGGESVGCEWSTIFRR